MPNLTFPVASTTTSKDILFELKNVLTARQSRELKSVRTYKLGVLPPQPTFPALNIMPELETYQYPFNGGKYQVQRDFLIEVFTKGKRPQDAMDESRDLIGYIKEILKENIWIRGQSVDVTITPRVFEEVVAFQGQYLQMGTIPIRATSYEFMPENRLEIAELVSTTSSELSKEIFNTLNNYRRVGGLLNLRRLQQMDRSRIPPIPTFPAMTLTEPQLDQDRTYAGLDAGDRLFEISIYSKLLDKDPMLTQVLDLVEPVKDILQINHLWGGRCLQSRIRTISFVRETLEIGKVYRATIRLFTQSQEVNPSY